MSKYIQAITTLPPRIGNRGVIKKVGQKIHAIRVAKNLSQSDIGRELLKDRQSIQRLETGKANITLKMLNELASVLKVEVKDFFDF